MTNHLDAVYRDELLTLAERAKASSPLVQFDREAVRYNPECGDVVRIQIRIQNAMIDDVSVQAEGCIICAAAAAVVQDAVKHKTMTEIKLMIQQARACFTHGEATDAMPQLALFSSVHHLPTRVRCAALGWEALESVVP